MATGSTSQAKARSARPATHPGQTSASRCCALSGEVRDPAAVPLPPWAIVMAVSRTHYGLIKQYRFTNCADLWCVNVIALKRTHIGHRRNNQYLIAVRPWLHRDGSGCRAPEPGRAEVLTCMHPGPTTGGSRPRWATGEQRCHRPLLDRKSTRLNSSHLV